mmetsp:Transcript_5278/g.16756  ORF Transcript_5278/g.16756 Transcript_5278/m.16756 type:complete len:392 (+) Transcript_5278:323-1498(+)
MVRPSSTSALYVTRFPRPASNQSVGFPCSRAARVSSDMFVLMCVSYASGVTVMASVGVRLSAIWRTTGTTSCAVIKGISESLARRSSLYLPPPTSFCAFAAALADAGVERADSGGITKASTSRRSVAAPASSAGPRADSRASEMHRIIHARVTRRAPSLGMDSFSSVRHFSSSHAATRSHSAASPVALRMKRMAAMVCSMTFCACSLILGPGCIAATATNVIMLGFASGMAASSVSGLPASIAATAGSTRIACAAWKAASAAPALLRAQISVKPGPVTVLPRHSAVTAVWPSRNDGLADSVMYSWCNSLISRVSFTGVPSLSLNSLTYLVVNFWPVVGDAHTHDSSGVKEGLSTRYAASVPSRTTANTCSGADEPPAGFRRVSEISTSLSS